MTTQDSDLFSLFANLELSLGRNTDEMAKSRAAYLNAWRIEQPRFIRIYGTVTPPASGFAVLSFDNEGPDQGRFWYLRKLIIGGLTPATTAAGRADIFVRNDDAQRYTTAAALGTTGWVDQATSLPLAGDFGRGEVPLQYTEKLYVVLSSATQNQQYVASGLVEDFQEGATSAEWSR